MPRILVAEDEREVRSYLEMALRCQGYAVDCAEDGEEALHCLRERRNGISLVLLDIIMPRKDGLETLREIRRLHADLPVIMLSGASAPFNVVDAMKSGATDFLGKPVEYEDLCRAVNKALGAHVSLGVEDTGPPEPQPDAALIALSPLMDRIVSALPRMAASDVPVLFLGETGVGKEILARQLHALSPRSDKLFLKINCAALPSELLESELFGYEKGAFTGAFKNKPGMFEVADGGTVLLDEIGDMDFKLQAKLLQVLQDHEFQRLGGRETVRVDVRVLAATHRDLELAIQDRTFREDLYYRLNVISVFVPPLRDRREEILPLASFMLRRYATPGVLAPEITSRLSEALLEHDWPGNIRELENTVRRFLVFRDGDMIAAELLSRARRRSPRPEELPDSSDLAGSNSLAHLPANWDYPQAAPAENLGARGVPGAPAAPLPPPAAASTEETSGAGPGPPEAKSAGGEQAPKPADVLPFGQLRRARELRRQAETATIVGALNVTRWNRKKAAALLNMEYKSLLYKIKKLGIEDQTETPVQEAEIRSADIQPDPRALEEAAEKHRQVETEAILAALAATRWNRKRAAVLLQLHYKALLYKMKKLGIEDRDCAPFAAKQDAARAS